MRKRLVEPRVSTPRTSAEAVAKHVATDAELAAASSGRRGRRAAERGVSTRGGLALKAPAGAKLAAQPAVGELPIIAFARPADWQRWLAKNHARARGLWLKLAKKNSGVRSITHAQAVEGALCWGWIDGQGRSHDDSYFLVKFTPRGARSIWSKLNRIRVAALIERGDMQPPGLAEVERAKREGRWEAAYDSPRTAAVPDDLVAALAKKPRAKAFFSQLKARNRYAILWRLQTAKRPETRARRLATCVAMLEAGEVFHPEPLRAALAWGAVGASAPLVQISDGHVIRMRSERSRMDTVQLTEERILELARTARQESKVA